MKTIDFITMGCSKNLVDTERLMHQLHAAGYHVRHDAKRPDASVVVINTCGFIGDAQEESIQEILRFAQRKQQGKLEKLYVMGCLSERFLHDLQQELPEVDAWFGKFDYDRLLPMLGCQWNSDIQLERHLTTPRHTAYLKIAEGCNRTCSYCAIPLITGPYLSRPMEDILEEARWMVRQGVKEVNVIAQDLTYYGQERYHEAKLPELVSRLADIDGIEWIRLHYGYPNHFPWELLKVMRERENVCNYMDIALQHVSDKMLRLMRRNSNKEETYDLVRRLREDVPDITLRTTLMVGHPGETQEDVDELEDFVRWARFDRMGAFTYSNEQGTYAYEHYQDDIPQAEKDRRLGRIMTIQEQIAAELNEQKVGKTLKVLIDRQEGDYWIGRTEGDSPEVDNEVLISPPKQGKSEGGLRELRKGQFYPVKITKAETFDLYGEIVK